MPICDTNHTEASTPKSKRQSLCSIIYSYRLFFLSVLFVLWKKGRKANRDVLIVGLCDSGKTALFSYLLYNKPIQSFTSQVENIGEFKSKKVCGKAIFIYYQKLNYLWISSQNLLRIVDIPGHERVFTKYWDAYKMNCKGVMFVVDSETVQTDICDVAE